MSKPAAVLISDVHYSLPTLKLADAAMRMAIAKANELDVPLIVAGDLHDTKANLRGECVNAMIETFELADIMPWILVGNHDKIHEKSLDNSLSFLAPYAHIVKEPMRLSAADLKCGAYLIPYQSSPDTCREYLKTAPKDKLIIMHQGLQSSNSGDYTQDKSAISKDDVSGFRVISGHYHNRQTISLPNGGSWSYIGNPYTLTYGEANDPPKGFQILRGDGTLEFVPTNLRKHIIMDSTYTNDGMFPTEYEMPEHGDLIWIKARGSKERLSSKSKRDIGVEHGLSDQYEFRLDLIPLDTTTKIIEKPRGNSELLDGLIDSLSNTSDNKKARLKELWRELE